MLKLTVLIPARLASMRLPNKPLADVAGLPLIARVAQQVLSYATNNIAFKAINTAYTVENMVKIRAILRQKYHYIHNMVPTIVTKITITHRVTRRLQQQVDSLRQRQLCIPIMKT